MVTVLDEEEFRNILMLMLAMTRRLRNIAIYKEPAKEIRNSLLYMCVYVCVVDATYTFAHAFEGQRPISSVVPQVPPPCFSACLILTWHSWTHIIMLASDVFWRSTSVLCLHSYNEHSIN